MKIHVHDNNSPLPKEHNCLAEAELGPDQIVTLHMHDGECVKCPKGHCHGGTINFLIVDGDLYFVLEGVKPPNLITAAKTAPHALKVH